MLQIPGKDCKEWEDLVSGRLQVKLDNFFLRTKLEQIIKDTDSAKLSIDEAITQTYKMFVEFSETRDITPDIEKIFGKEILSNNRVDNTTGIEPEVNDITARVDKIMLDALEKNRVLQQKISANKSNGTHTTSKLKPENKTPENKPQNAISDKEKLKKESIERRNKELKKQRNALKNEKGGFFRSIFG